MHACDRVSLKSLPSNAKPVVPVFRQVSHFQTGPRPTGGSFQNVMPSSGQTGPPGGIKPSIHQSFGPPFSLSPHVHLPCLAFSLSLSPSTGKYPSAAAARPRSVGFGSFYWRLSVYLLSLCRLSSAAQRNGDSLDSRVRPRADGLHPNRSVSFIFPNIFSFHHPEML